MLSRPSHQARPGPSTRETATTQFAIVEHVPSPMAVLDERGRFVALNAAWKGAAAPGALIGPDDAVGHDYLHLLRDEKGFNLDAGRALADVIQAVLQGEAREEEYAYTLAGEGADHGDAETWSATVSRMEADGDVFAVIVQQPRSHETRIEALQDRFESLAAETEQAHAVAADRRRLVHAAQQEAHGPMTPVRLQMHLLKNGALGDLTERQEAAIARIERNLHRFWRLHDKFLTDLTALEGRTAAAEATAMAAVLEEAIQPFRERCIQAGINLRVDRTDDELPVRVEVRPAVQTVMMLMDHAIRATPSGGLVWVRLREVRGKAELTIQDQDPGMDRETAETLLDEDAVGDHPLWSAARHARAVMERNGGAFRIHCSGPGKGLEATLAVPLR